MASSIDASTAAASFARQPLHYLIIGGGTSGLVVAARLSENPNITVGVLEAGPAAFNEPLINIPGRFGESLGTEYDWKFETTPQPGIGGRKLPWPRGKVLGGTSALNFMTWNRGCREDYDAWETLGNEGWGWNGLLPFFKKSESFCTPAPSSQVEHSLHFSPMSHGTKGPISSVYSTEFGTSHGLWHPTLNSLGIETNRSHFAGSNVGAWTSLTSVEPRTRTRCYSATGHYKPVASRPNLTILTEALVEEILVEQVNNEWTATGARFSSLGKEYVVKATKEVILCAGSVQSPQLLELSGIGNPAILHAAGTALKVANPKVGENLQDHIMTATIYEISPEIVTADDLRFSPELLASAMQEYTTKATGPLTQLPSSICYLPFSSVISPSSFAHLRALVPNPPLTSSPLTTLRHRVLISRFETGSNLGQIEYNFDTSNYSPYFVPQPGKKYATMLQMLQYPFSVGSIHIPPSKNKTRTTVHDKPVIDPKYYEGPGGEVDFRTMVEAQAFGHKITQTKPLSSIIVKRVFPPLPEEGETEMAVWEDYVRNYTITDWHPVGTCAMGPLWSEKDAEGFGGVVDARLRVHGLKGLRVVDASIMPLQVSAHLQATVYAIGEKGSSLILEDYEKLESGRL